MDENKFDPNGAQFFDGFDLVNGPGKPLTLQTMQKVLKNLNRELDEKFEEKPKNTLSPHRGDF